MLRLLKQLFIERILSGGVPYIAFHPELGVPIGIFNTKDEPNRQSRIESIKKLGKYGNPTSSKLAKLLGIDTPIPSFVLDPDEKKEVEEMVKEAYERGKADGSAKSGGFSGKDATLKLLGEINEQRKANERLTLDDIGNIKKSLSGLSTKQEKVGETLKLFALEDTITSDISSTIGMTNSQLREHVDYLNRAANEASAYGLTAYDLNEVWTDTVELVGRKLNIPEHVLTRSALLGKTLEGFDAKSYMDAFDSVGLSMDSAIGATDDTTTAIGRMIKTSRDLGAVSSSFMKNASENIKLMNKYGFERGYEGLARMVVKSDQLGISMSDVAGLAEKFLDPEGAIDFAAKMQVIGGAAGDLTDPFKLMYMATNDLEGLQDAIVETAAASATFNEETGEFGFSPEQRRQMRDQASELGMSYEDYSEMAIKAARSAEALNQLEFVGGMTDEDKELVASMATIGKDGAAKIKIPGMEEMVDVANITDQQMERLKEGQLTDREVYDQQLDAAEKSNQWLASIDTAMREMVAQGGDASDIDAKSLSRQIFSDMNMEMTDEQRTAMKSGTMAERMVALEEVASQNASKLSDAVIAGLKNIGVDVELAEGGIVNEPVIAQVGEAGPEAVIPLDRLSEMLNTAALGGDGTGGGTGSGGGVLRVEGTLNVKGDGSESAELNIKQFINSISSGDLQKLNSLLQNAIS
jgi:hypothetical protein